MWHWWWPVMTGYGANHLVTTTCVQKSYEIKREIPNLFPLGKMLLLMGQKDPQEELNLDSNLGEFFFPCPIPNLHMADKSIHFHQVWCSKCWMMHVQFFQVALQGYITSKSLLLIALFIVKVYMFWPPSVKIMSSLIHLHWREQSQLQLHLQQPQ